MGNTLATYAYPIIGDLAVSAVATDHVQRILEPIWTEKTETASRLRGRLENVLDYATTRGWRSGENPARWKGHLEHILADRAKVQVRDHHAALPWQQAPAFLGKAGGTGHDCRAGPAVHDPYCCQDWRGNRCAVARDRSGEPGVGGAAVAHEGEERASGARCHRLRWTCCARCRSVGYPAMDSGCSLAGRVRGCRTWRWPCC